MPDQTPDLAQAVAALRGILARKQQDDAAEAKAIAELDTLIHAIGVAPTPPKPSGPGLLSRFAASVGAFVRRIPYQWVAIIALAGLAVVEHGGTGISCANLTPIVKPVVQTGPIRVVVVHNPTANNSAAQLNVIGSTTIRSYLDAHCVKDSDGNPAWRVWPADVDVSGESASWQDAWAKAKPLAAALPCVVIFPAGGFPPVAAPLPADDTAALTLLSKYGGK